MTARLLNVRNAAVYLGVPVGTLRRWAHNRQIPFVKSGEGRSSTVLFDRVDLDAWIEAHKVPADAS